jgi:hypothetical protein
MSRARVSFKKNDLKRAVQCVTACGLKVEGVEIEGGKFRVLTGEPQATNGLALNDLDAELERFEAKHGQD